MPELDRLRELSDLAQIHGPDWEQSYKPKTMGCHEAFFAAGKAADFVTLSLLHHPAIILNPEWYSLADQSVRFLNMLYSKIDQAHSVRTMEFKDVG